MWDLMQQDSPSLPNNWKGLVFLGQKIGDVSPPAA